jgi:cation:H+ antiporter
MCAWGSNVTRIEGGLLLGTLLLGTAITAGVAVRSRTTDLTTPIEWVLGVPTHLGTIAAFIAIGLVVLPLGADLLVEAATQIASVFGVSETVIGLTVVAVGTSLPEVATTVVAGLRRKTVMVVGTIVGSNMFNLLAIMGAASVASPDPIGLSRRSLLLDLPVMVAASMMLVGLAWFRHPIRRRTGIGFLVIYGLYTALVYWLG